MAIAFCALESVLSFHHIFGSDGPHHLFGLQWDLDHLEDCIFYVIIGFWTARFLHARFFMPAAKKGWPDVLAQKHQHRKDADHFEYQDADEFEFSARGEQPGIDKGQVLINKRELLPVWLFQTGDKIGELGVEQSLKAKGVPFLSDKYGMRFDPREDKLLSKDSLIQLYEDQSRSEEEATLYWTEECKARMLVPIVWGSRPLSDVSVSNGDVERANTNTQVFPLVSFHSSRAVSTAATEDCSMRHSGHSGEAAVELAHVRILTEEEDPEVVLQRQSQEDCNETIKRELFWSSKCLIS